jgi:antitoxin VapB
MALSTKDPETERLAKRLAQLTGETITTATKRAIEQRLRRLGGQSRRVTLLEDMAEIRRRWSEMPVADDRTPEEILGYDEPDCLADGDRRVRITNRMRQRLRRGWPMTRSGVIPSGGLSS